jgi:hypothetical protein
METWQEIGEPNLGLMRSAIEPRMSGSEDFTSVMDTTFRIARQRSSVFVHSPTYLDLEIVASVLCWWPLKPEPTPNYTSQVTQLRGSLLRDPADIDSYLSRYFPQLNEPGPFQPSLPFVIGVPPPGWIPQSISDLLPLLITLPADAVVNFLLSQAGS